MADYSGEIAFTTELIADFGADVTIRRNASNTPNNPAKPWDGNTIDNVDYIQKGVIFGIKNRYAGNDLLRDGDGYCLIASSTIDITPTPKDLFINLGRIFEIIKVVSIEPANQQILFKVYFKGQAIDS